MEFFSRLKLKTALLPLFLIGIEGKSQEMKIQIHLISHKMVLIICMMLDMGMGRIQMMMNQNKIIRIIRTEGGEVGEVEEGEGGVEELGMG